MAAKIRHMRREDTTRVLELVAELSAHEGAAPPPFDHKKFETFGFGPGKCFDGLVAEVDGEVVAYMFYHPAFNVGAGGPGIHMIDLYVEPGHRKSGIGKSFIAALARECLDNGGLWITWQSLDTNDTALGFYHRIGGRRFRAADFELAGKDLKSIARQ